MANKPGKRRINRENGGNIARFYRENMRLRQLQTGEKVLSLPHEIINLSVYQV
jgi:hypothetical protein